MAKVLVAEDDQISQRVVQKMLTDLGHEVFVSPNGRHAWETLTIDDTFELLVTDVMMPEMSGLELIEHVRSSEVYANLPIIIVSAYVGVKDIARFLETGATMFQAKPIQQPELAENIDRVLAV
ncbi:MAG: response regulator [Thermodesulfobacteriota bacterium]|nr:response regulator [Thermodesulfobacteriota bacterium]